MTEIKHARDMSPEEYKSKLAELRRGPPPKPVTLPEKRAAEMTDQEKSEWFSEHRKKFNQ